MTRFPHTLAAIGLALALAPAALAGNNHGDKKPTPQPTHGTTYGKPVTFAHTAPYTTKNYHLIYGTKFAHGIYYHGIRHTHWLRVYYNPFYRCYVYVDPYTLVEYYWCPPANCFYPVSYIPYGTYQFGPTPLPPAAAGVAGAPAAVDVPSVAKPVTKTKPVKDTDGDEDTDN